MIQRLAIAPQPSAESERRGDVVAWLIAAALGAWVLVYKLKDFEGLGTTSDLYQFAQLSTSWLEGRFLQDNCYGNHLAIHTYFLMPLFAAVVVPFGPAGLLLVLSVAAALNMLGLYRLLRLLRVPGRVALAYSTLATMMPLSLNNYQDRIYGFHVELLVPVLSIWFAYYLLKERWVGSALIGLALLAVKEDAPLIVALVSSTVACEKLLCWWSEGRPSGWRGGINLPAVSMAGLSIAVVFLFLQLLREQQMATGHLGGYFQRVRLVAEAGVQDGAGLIAYVAGNLSQWIRSPTMEQWMGMALAGSFGLILCRPHYWLIGTATTLVAWLMQDDFLWAPRFAQSLAFLQIAACFSLASVWQMTEQSDEGRRRRTQWGVGVCCAGVVVCAYGIQLMHVPHVAAVYQLSPVLPVEPAEKAKADRVYTRFAQEHRPGQPVIASTWLFRYVPVDDLYWFDRLRGRPVPQWILWDKETTPLFALWSSLRVDANRDVSDYKLVAEEGRFLLFRHKTAEDKAREQVAGIVSILGETDGLFRLKIRIADGRAGLAEPLLSMGQAGQGALFFLRYLSEEKLLLGFEQVGTAVYVSSPVTFSAGKEYELELFTGAMLPRAGGTQEQGVTAETRLLYQNLVQARWNGQIVLEALLPHAFAPADPIRVGVNWVKADSAGPRFLGTVDAVVRGGYPELPGKVSSGQGAVRLLVHLPKTASGSPEPLIVIGAPGEACLGYIRMLTPRRFKVGIEVWGYNAYESEPIETGEDSPVEIVYSLPALFPPHGDFRWQGIPADREQELTTSLLVSVNGQEVLRRVAPAPRPRVLTTVYGTNPVGGSWVGAAFSGEILQVSRIPWSASVAPASEGAR